jgi:putative tryptophan/tyrosine transport system substrate-binding protein
MQRREFIAAALGGAAAAWPITARAQPPQGTWRIGMLATTSAHSPAHEAFRQSLRDLGYIEGQNLTIEFRESAGTAGSLRGLAAELVKLRVDVIFASGSEATRAARQETTDIPIVTISSNPVGLGFVASLARPGGNVTGLSLLAPESSGKRLELLRQVIPGVARIALLWNPNDPGAAFSLKETQTAAATLGLSLQILETPDGNAFDHAFQAAIKEGAEAIILLPAPLMDANAGRIAEFALKHRLATMYFSDFLPRAGGLMSYGVSLIDVYRRAANYVDRILKGAKPADLPVEQPTKFDLVINLKTAKALGLEVPPTLLATADDVIE